MAPPRHFTYRVQNIPFGMTETELKACFHSDDRKHIQVKSLVPDVLNYSGSGTKTATFLFSPQDPREPRVDEVEDDIELDKNFLGFTPLSETIGDVAADIIAVTGLAGHAYGSWAHSPQKMWLRDYLPKDIQYRARILIYGYESQLRGPTVAKSIISDYGSAFIQNLLDIRNHPSCRDRPLILIGHSLGGLIIKQALADLRTQIRSRLPVRAVLFFGAPHNGLEVEALQTLVKGQPTETLIGELKHDSPTLSGLSDRFLHIADGLSIHSYYESQQTQTVIQNSTGEWERSGPFKVMVGRSSALIGHSQEIKHSVDGDHSQMVKLRSGQGSAYPSVLRIIIDALKSASEKYDADAQAKPDTSQTSESLQCTAPLPTVQSSNIPSYKYGLPPKPAIPTPNKKANNSTKLPPQPATPTPNKRTNNPTKFYDLPDRSQSIPRKPTSTPSKTPSSNKRDRGQNGRGNSQIEPRIACFKCKQSFDSRTKLFKHLDEAGHR